MLKIGDIQELTIVKTVQFGVYLAEENAPEERVLLPKKEVPAGAKAGDRLSVFLYKDSEDRPIATTREPKLTLGKLAMLKVKDVTKIGAFLDWGLEKDLLLPFKEQERKVSKGESVMAALYTDKSGRLCATTKLYPYLKTNSPYVIGDEVEIYVYELHEKYGVFVAVDGAYSGLIPKKDAQGSFYIGETAHARVTEVKEDGRVCVATRKKAYQQLEPDGDVIMDALHDAGGEFDFDDHADPEFLREKFGMSKAAFKRAVGHLMKQGLVVIKNGKIRMK